MQVISALPPMEVMLTTARAESMYPPLVYPDDSVRKPSWGSIAISALPCLRTVMPEHILPYS